MSTPLGATGRITIPYVVQGKTHKARFYIRGLTLVGAVWMHNSRTLDENDQVWTDSAEALATTIGEILPTPAAYASLILEQLVSGVWITRDVHTTTTVPGSGTVQYASQNTMVLRDKLFRKVKVVILEGNSAAPQHWVDPTGGGGNYPVFTAQFQASGLVAHKPYNWLVGRGNQYLADTPFVAFTITLNRKLRRTRGLT